MDKVQLFTAYWNNTLPLIIPEIKKWNSLNQDNIKFKVLRVEDDSFYLRFIEKKTIIKVIFDEDKEERNIKYENFIHTNFFVNKFFPQIMIENPPRSVKQLLHILSELSYFQIAIIPLRIDLKKFISISKDEIPNFKLKYTNCTTLFESKDIKSKFSFEGDNLWKIVNKYPKSHILKLKFEIEENFRLYMFDLSEKGLLAYSETYKELEGFKILIDIIRRSIHNTA